MVEEVAMEQELARAIINKLGSTGTPPEFGIEAFTVGLDRYLKVIEEEYLDGILKFNLSSFKLITGNYGGGKTHFLYSVRNLAFRHNYCVAYVSLNPTECPFDKLELVYKAVALNLTAPQPTDVIMPLGEKGIDAVIRRWAGEWRKKEERTERLESYLLDLPMTDSSSFFNAVRGAFQSLLAEDLESFQEAVQWLKGEEADRETRAKFRISERIDRSSAFRMLRSLAQWVHAIGYRGLILLFDEAERGMSIASARDKRRALDNLRQLVDECGNSRLPGAMFFYAVPDDNLLLEGSGPVYEALKQRLRSVFSEANPVGVRINLEELGMEPVAFLEELGVKLRLLFEQAYGVRLNGAERVLKVLAQTAVERFVLDVSYRRLFVVAAVELLHRLRVEPNLNLSTRDAEKILRVTTQKLEKREKEAVESEEF
uniref:ATP-binding protein n=1 Tax=candidate division WOR-3 bacterium TaxID=2052148 RepID=A0A7C3EL77_UNCW3